MKRNKDGKIIEVSEAELFSIYQFMREYEDRGVKITGRSEDNEA